MYVLEIGDAELGTPILWRRSDILWRRSDKVCVVEARSGSGPSKRRARHTPEPRRRSGWRARRCCSHAPTRWSS